LGRDYRGCDGHAGTSGIDRHAHEPARRDSSDIDKAAAAGSPAPSGLSADEKRAYETLAFAYKNFQYGSFMGSRPQTLYGIASMEATCQPVASQGISFPDR
jgi:hypothetical protein